MMQDLHSLLVPFVNPHASGEDLRYTHVHDTIREARRDEDPRLTQGVWEQEVKQADWTHVEMLTSEALRNQSKDLKIAGWLGEAWITLHKLEGLDHALKLIQGLCTHFWDTLYPCDPDDLETRVRCFEWIDTQWAERMHTIPISTPSIIKDRTYHLLDWIDAHHYAKMAKQSEGQKTKTLPTEQAQLLDAVRTAIAHTEWSYYEGLLSSSHTIHQTLLHIETLLQTLLQPQFHVFNKIKETLGIFEALIRADPRAQKPTLQPIIEEQNEALSNAAESKSSSLSGPASSSPSTYDDVYQTITTALNTLTTHEPHSPVIPLLQAALRWKDLSFLDLLKLFEDVGLNAQQVLKLFKVDKTS